LFSEPVIREATDMADILTRFVLLGISMHPVENIRVGEEGTEAGLRAEVQDPPAIFGARIEGRVGVTEYAPTQGHEARPAVFLLFP
jgi:hypothetical protein